MKDKITINLIPQELRVAQKKEDGLKKLQLFGTMFILLLIFLSSLSYALRILQSQSIDKAQRSVEGVESQISKLQIREQSVLTLKDRVVNISRISALPSKQRIVYNLVKSLTPAGVTISTIAVERDGTAAISIAASDNGLIDNFTNSLLSPEKNGGKISRVEIDNLSRGSDKFYRASMKVIPN